MRVLTLTTNIYFSASQFVAYSLVAFPIVGIGIIGNLLSLLVLSRPNLKGGQTLEIKISNQNSNCQKRPEMQRVASLSKIHFKRTKRVVLSLFLLS